MCFPRQISLAVGAVVSPLALTSFSASTQPQAHPTRVIRLIVPVVPGGGSDFIAQN
jgi:tripartite-type tricarboxylate transporter receptor subunit TctC